MTYGVVSTDTRAWIERRARETETPMNLIDLESESEMSLEVSVIVGGALDEEFAVSSDYAAQVVDWLAEIMPEQCGKEFWELTVSSSWGDSLYYVAGGEE